MEVLELIEKAESLVSSGKRVPLAGKMILVDEGQLKETIEKLRLTIPKELQEAQQLLQEGEDIIGKAQREAKRITTAAEEEFRARVRDSNIVKAAERRAEEITKEAQSRAEAVVSAAEKQASTRTEDANQYSLGVLRSLERQLNGALTSIRKGIEILEKGEKSPQ